MYYVTLYLRFFEYFTKVSESFLKFATDKYKESASSRDTRSARTPNPVFKCRADRRRRPRSPAHLGLTFISKQNYFEDRYVGFDGVSLNASKRPETPFKPTSVLRPPEPTKRSCRCHPSMTLDPIPIHISAICHGSEHRFSSNLTVHRVGRCCCR